jgi:hypothetical protein
MDVLSSRLLVRPIGTDRSRGFYCDVLVSTYRELVAAHEPVELIVKLQLLPACDSWVKRIR